MTKLEEKLEELGYTQSCQTIYRYFKCTPVCTIYAYVHYDRTQCGLRLEDIDDIYKQEQLDDLQEAFNIMKKDLEELKNAKD